ncbi:hypothetical protein AAHE18_12G032100 [Arachis hypogaea]
MVSIKINKSIRSTQYGVPTHAPFSLTATNPSLTNPATIPSRNSFPPAETDRGCHRRRGRSARFSSILFSTSHEGLLGAVVSPPRRAAPSSPLLASPFSTASDVCLLLRVTSPFCSPLC